MKRRTGTTFRLDQIVARAKAMQLEIHPNSWPYCMFCALREIEPPTSDGHAEYWQELRKTVVAALREHETKFKYVFLEDVPFPAEIAEYLATALHDFTQGEPHPLFERRILHGGRGNIRRRRQQECIDAGVDYLVAVDSGLIKDERSRTAVAKRFGVTRKQVQRWLAGRGADARRRKELQDRWRLRLVYDHDPPKTAARMIRKVMHWLGDEYRVSRKTRSRVAA